MSPFGSRYPDLREVNCRFQVNSPYQYPGQHWQLDADGELTGQLIHTRREAKFVSPIPKPRKRKSTQTELGLDEGYGLSSNGVRPFFCQIEAVETAIWLTEVAPKAGNNGHKLLEHLANANHDVNPELSRLALKLATGAGKTTVMAMIIAWQTINAVRHHPLHSRLPGSLQASLSKTGSMS